MTENLDCFIDAYRVDFACELDNLYAGTRVGGKVTRFVVGDQGK